MLKNKKYEIRIGIRIFLLMLLIAFGSQYIAVVLDLEDSTAYGYSVDKVLSKAVADSKTSSNNSFNQKMDYTDADGYKGSLSKNGVSFVKSGSYNPGRSGHDHRESGCTKIYGWQCEYGKRHTRDYYFEAPYIMGSGNTPKCPKCKAHPPHDYLRNMGFTGRWDCGQEESEGTPAIDTRIYQQNYSGTVYKTVTEYPKLTNIVIVKQPNKIHYKEYEDFNPEGMVVQAIYADGHQEEVTGYMLSKKTNLDHFVTSIRVTFSDNGGTVYTDIPITVAKLTGIYVSKLPETVEYLEGLVNIDLIGGKLALEFNDGSTKEIPLTEASVITHGSEVGEIEIKVGYKEFTTIYKAKVKAKSPVRLEILAPPSRTDYIEGLPFEKEGMEVKVYYDNNTEAMIEDYIIENGTSLSYGQTSITITYTENGVTKTIEQGITIRKKLPTKLEIVTPPSRIEYIEGLSFEKEGMEVKVYYDNNTEAMIEDYIIENGESLSFGQTSITITYTENGVTKTIQQAITVRKKLPTKLEIVTPPSRTEYIEGLSFEKEGMEVKVYYDNNTEAMIEDYIIENGESLSFGQTSVTITYTENGMTKTIEQEITVRKKSPTKIEIVTPPSKTEYIEELSFDLKGISVKVLYDNGTFGIAKELSSTDGAALQLGQTFVTIKYTENNATVTCQQAITVIKKSAIKLIVEKVPDKVKYEWSDPLNLSGSAIRMYYDNGKDELLALDQVTASGYEAKKTGKQTITVTREGCSDTFEIEVGKAPVTEITLLTSPGAIVVQDGLLDMNDATIKVTRADDSQETVEVTMDMISQFDSSVLGKQILTITYEGKQCEFEVTVIRRSSNKPNEEKPIGEIIVKGEDDLNKSDVILSEGENGNIKVKVNRSHDSMYMIVPMIDNKVARNVIDNEIPSFQTMIDGKLYVKISKDAEFEFIDNDKSFIDINQHWAKKEIEQASAREIFAGVGKRKFAPNENMTKGMLAAVLHRLDDNKSVASDYKNQKWYDASVAWAIENDITKEKSNQTFQPESDITREELANMIYNFAEYSGTDVTSSKDALHWMIDHRILIGRPDGDLDPDGFATRGEVATMLNKGIVTMLIEGKEK